MNTAKIYISLFEEFINHYGDIDLLAINDEQIRDYLSLQLSKGKSDSTLNQIINSIKFNYEVVLEMPNRYYHIERPKQRVKLPEILSKATVKLLIGHTNNIKHRCIVSLIYSAELQYGELINLKIKDIDSTDILIRVEDSDRRKDMYTLLSKNMVKDFSSYYLLFKTIVYLFEGEKGGKYSGSRIGNIIRQAATTAKIRIKVKAHTLRHSFATHLLEDGVSLRDIQVLLGYSPNKATEIYTYVAKNYIYFIKNPLD